MSDRDVDRAARRLFPSALLLASALFVTQGLYYARHLIPVPDGVHLTACKPEERHLAIADQRGSATIDRQ